MFDHVHRSARSAVDTDRLKAQAAEVGAVLSEASVHAGRTAAQLADEARVAAAHAVEWATPRVEKAWREGARAAAPKIEKAAEKAVPVVDTAHDRLVEDLLPRVAAAVTAALAATAAGADKARDAASAKLVEVAHLEVPEPPRSHTGRKVFWWLTAFAAVGAALTAWRRSRPTIDPWAEQPWETTADSPDRFKHRAAEAREELSGVVADVRHELGDAAEVVGEAAGEAVARTREATEKAREATEKAAERAREATRKAAPRRKAGAAAATGAGAEEGVEGVFTPETDVVTPTGEATGADTVPTDVPGQADAPDATSTDHRQE